MDEASILIIAPETLPVPPVKGGAVQTVIYEQTRRMQPMSLAILSPHPGRCPNKEQNESLRLQYIHFPDQPSDKKSKRMFYLREVQERMQDLKPRVIHIHNRPDFVTAIKQTCPKTKLILHLHNDHLSNLSQKEQNQVLKACDQVLCVSKYLHDKISTTHKRFRHKILVMHNGIDTEKFTGVTSDQKKNLLKEKYGFSSDEILLLYVGRIVPQKGLHKILKALLKMRKKERKNVKLIIAGSSAFGVEKQTEYEHKVRELSRKLGNHVVFLGYVDQEQLPAYYRMADIYLAPMQWEEPFGLVIGEAAACELPVIASKRGGIPEMIEHEKTGLLLPPKFTSKQLLDQIRYLIRKPRIRRKLGKAARKRIEDSFRWDHSSRRLKKIYKKALGE